MHVLELSTMALPYRYRLLINLMALVMHFFGRDERWTALTQLLYFEIDDDSEDAEHFNQHVHQLAGALKVQRRYNDEP